MKKNRLLFEEQFPIMYQMRFDDADVRRLITTAEAIQFLDRLELSEDGTGLDVKYLQKFRSKDRDLNTAIRALVHELDGLTSISTSGSPLLNVFLGERSLPYDREGSFGSGTNFQRVRERNIKRPFGAVFFDLEDSFYSRVLITNWRETGDEKLFDEFSGFRLAVFDALSTRARSIISNVIEDFFQNRTPSSFLDHIPKWRELKGSINSKRSDVFEWIYGLSSEKSVLPLNSAELKAIRNRMQAYNIYGLLFPYLTIPEVTSVIDQGSPVEPVLRTVSGLSSHQFAALKNISRKQPTLASLSGGSETSTIMATLSASNISISEWETLFLSEKSDAILEKVARAAHHFQNILGAYMIFPASTFYGSSNEFYDATISESTISDSLSDLHKDLLAPIFEAINASLDVEEVHLLRVTAMEILRPQLGEVRNKEVAQELKKFWQTVHAAIVGKKTHNGFQKSLRQLHKFSSSIAAKRRSILQTERVWPELFPAWRSKNGDAEIRFLRSTTALVEEGLRMRHCVGSYDDKCEAGGTHIASISINGTPVATVEIRTELADTGIRINLVQFASTANAQPSLTAHRAMQEFWGDVKGLKIQANFAEVYKHQSSSKSSAGAEWFRVPKNRATMTLDKAEKLWPFYRENLLVTHPEAASLKEWMKASGISKAKTRLCRVIRRAQAAQSAALMANKDILEMEESHAPIRSL
jgi:hypothetical protein